MTKKEEEKNNKKFVPILLLLLGVIMIGGVSLAFFSDILTGEGSVTAGTLDIEPIVPGGSPFAFYQDKNGDGEYGDDEELESLLVANFNPGDCVLVKGNAKNVGNKSAWVRASLALGDDGSTYSDGMIFAMGGARGYETVVGSDGTDINTLVNDTTLTSGNPVIINGGSANTTINEVETDGEDTYDAEAFTICFNKDATNDEQGKVADLNFKIEAIQYRNNINAAGNDAAGWDGLTTDPWSISITE